MAVTTSQRPRDPRRALSRAYLIDAATSLLLSGGPDAVTVEAVTRLANVARATLYRHFPSGSDLLAAAFCALIPPAPSPPADGSLQDRLAAVVQQWAQSIAETSVSVMALSWLGIRAHIKHASPSHDDGTPDSPAIRTLRQRISAQFAAPLDAVLDSPEAAAELSGVDRTTAVALLIGPIVLGKMSRLNDFDYRGCAHTAVAGFLATHRAQS
jgi:AcrR family transcriptional regulator